MRPITSGSFCFQQRSLVRISKEANRDRCVRNAVSFSTLKEKFSKKTFYNASSLADVDIYLLGEFHGSKKSSPTNGELISFLASKNSIILFLESYELLKEVSDESSVHAIMDKLCINPAVRNNIRFFGWNLKMDPKIKNILDSLVFIRNCIEIDSQTLKIANDSNFPDPMTQPWLNEIGQQEKMVLVLQQVEERLLKNDQIRKKLNSLLLSELENRFPFQTANMISALKVAKMFPGKTVFQCGAGHLYPLSSAYNLNPLWEELSNHKAVSLIPNDIEKYEDLTTAEKIELIQEGKIPFAYS